MRLLTADMLYVLTWKAYMHDVYYTLARDSVAVYAMPCTGRVFQGFWLGGGGSEEEDGGRIVCL